MKKLAAENDAAAEERDRQKHLRQIESNKEFAELNIELQVSLPPNILTFVDFNLVSFSYVCSLASVQVILLGMIIGPVHMHERHLVL